LLLADEPTGNLDPETARQIGALLGNIREQRGTTVVVVTHDRAVVDAMQRRVVRLRDGKIISDENPGVYHPEDEIPTDQLQSRQAAPQISVPLIPAAKAEPEPEPEPAAEAQPELPVAAPTTVSPPIAVEPVIEPVAVPSPERALAEDPGRETAPDVATEQTEEVASLPGSADNNAPIGSADNPIVLFDR
jgi:cell division transport system ATP-binding protein